MLCLLLLSLVAATPLLVVEFSKAGLATPSLQLGGEDPGKLTELGRAGMEKNGQLLRQHFEEYMPPTYSSDQVMIKTFDEEVYLDSAVAYLRGLYPAQALEVSNIRTSSRTEDPVLGPRPLCPRIDWITERDQRKSSLYTRLLDVIGPYHKDLLELTNSTSFEAIARLGEAVHSLQARNMSLPDFPSDLYKLAHKAYSMRQSILPYGSEEAIRLGAYSVLEELLQLILTVATNKAPVKVALIILEDSTLAALLKALEMHKEVPGDNAHFTVTIDRDYSLRFFYNGIEQWFGQCDRPCFVKQFYRNIAEVTFESKEDWAEACATVGDAKSINKQHVLVFVMSAAAVFSIAFLRSGKPDEDKQKNE